MMSRISQEPTHVECFPFFSPMQEFVVTPALSFKAPSQESRLAILCRLKCRIRRAHDTLPQVLKAMAGMVTAIQSKVEIFASTFV